MPWRAPWHDHAGVVRCEVASGFGLAEAMEVAGRVSALLPRYAGRPAQNVCEIKMKTAAEPLST